MDNKTSKPFGYWNDRNHLQEEADKYTCKVDFLNGCASAYRAAQRQGILDEICKNYTKNENVYMDLYKEIHSVYVYEVEKTHSCYVGRTINLQERDLSHRRGRKHSDGRITYDSLYIHCKDNGVNIPTPKVLEENLNAKDSLIKEDYWLKEYVNNGWSPINVAKTGETSGSLGAVKLWTYDACKEFCKNYSYKSEIKEANYTCYTTCLKNGWFDEFGIKEKYSSWESKDKCIEAAKSCQSKTEFIKKFYGAYMKVMKNGWIDDIDDIFEKDESDTEKKLCDDYNSGMTLKEVSDKYNISTYRIVKIMGKYGIMPRNKGGLKISKKTKVELKANDGFHYVAIDRNTKFETRDYLNKAGVLTSYIRNQYHVDVPTIHFRKKYKEEHGKEWWEQWFDIKEVENKETRKCPLCDWKTIDVYNKSGALEMHLRKKHNISRDEYLRLYYNC